MSLLLVISSNSISVLHHFQVITTFTVRLTTDNLEKSFNFNTTLKIILCICLLANICNVFQGMDLERFQMAEVTFKDDRQ